MDEDEKFSMNEEARREQSEECPNCGSDSLFDNEDYWECDECEFKWSKGN